MKRNIGILLLLSVLLSFSQVQAGFICGKDRHGKIYLKNTDVEEGYTSFHALESGSRVDETTIRSFCSHLPVSSRVLFWAFKPSTFKWMKNYFRDHPEKRVLRQRDVEQFLYQQVSQVTRKGLVIPLLVGGYFATNAGITYLDGEINPYLSSSISAFTVALSITCLQTCLNPIAAKFQQVQFSWATSENSRMDSEMTHDLRRTWFRTQETLPWTHEESRTQFAMARAAVHDDLSALQLGLMTNKVDQPEQVVQKHVARLMVYFKRIFPDLQPLAHHQAIAQVVRDRINDLNMNEQFTKVWLANLLTEISEADPYFFQGNFREGFDGLNDGSDMRPFTLEEGFQINPYYQYLIYAWLPVVPEESSEELQASVQTESDDEDKPRAPQIAHTEEGIGTSSSAARWSLNADQPNDLGQDQRPLGGSRSSYGTFDF